MTANKEKIESLLGECEVEKLKNGRYIVMYMNFSAPPPPTGATREEAMEKFIEWYEARQTELSPTLPDPEEVIDGDTTG